MSCSRWDSARAAAPPSAAIFAAGGSRASGACAVRERAEEVEEDGGGGGRGREGWGGWENLYGPRWALVWDKTLAPDLLRPGLS